MTFTPYNYVVLYIYSLEMYFLNMFQWTQTFFPHKSQKKGRKKTALESSPQCQSVLLLQIWIWPLPVPFVRKHWLSVQSDDSDLLNDPGSRTKFNIKNLKKISLIQLWILCMQGHQTHLHFLYILQLTYLNMPLF